MTMTRRELAGLAVAGAAATLAAPAVAAVKNAGAARRVVLVHGLFADGSCWLDVIGRLQARGLDVVSVQNPLTTLPETVASVRRVLDRMPGPVVLAGHSFAGTILTEVGVHPRVASMVYVSARAPDIGEDYAALVKTFPPAPASSGFVFDGDECRLTEEAFVRDFANGLPLARARALYAVQQPFLKPLVAGRTTQAAWRTKPCTYVVTAQDRTTVPELQRFMAKRMGAKTVEVEAGHLGLVSRADVIADLIAEAADHA